MPDGTNVGLIGYKFMGKAHSHAFRTVDKFFDPTSKPVMKAICGRDEQAVSEFAERWGWESYETSWQTLVSRDDIDLVDIGTPGSTHAEMAIAAAQAGKHVFCEKPMAMNLAECRAMLEAARAAGVKHMVNHNYRRVPAVSLAKRMIEADEIGEIRHARFTYLQDWLTNPEFPMNWRLRKESAGSGAHGDLGSHMIDLAHFLVGDLDSVVGQKKTYITERPAEGTSSGLTATAGEGTEQVTVDDHSMWLTKFANGALGSFEATRLAAGRRNFNRFEINGSKGSLVWCFEDMNWLEFYSTESPAHEQGFRRILATEECHPYAGNWWPPGHLLGYDHTFVHAVYDLLEDIAHDRPCWPDFRDGAQVVAVLEAVNRSIDSGSWADVERVE
ncbi:Gfo/Idh/MocA family protein [Aeoliella mucimassa]|uniref:Glucose--fructose oxidoreductase n=1 Tax=Aeoliella mucimassa TaxID=2527972 RepID=A0A518AU11_9BACT|nr:Gfo/Idh/MocA family oxidoreductase [Aeoliella mucimassa]QDU58212.1 Glucose--fructose oxidoreductase precursor [Aeoliella mucimassa]